jgi:hypothetical protein
MFKKVNRKVCLSRYPKFPQSDNQEEVFFFPKFYRRYILILSSKSPKGDAKGLAAEMVNLSKHLGITSLIFLGDTETPWLHQQNDYPRAKLATKYLSKKKVGRKFNGGFAIGAVELLQFIPHLFWLVRCNAALPIVHFMDKDQNFIGSICKYGNLHFFTLNKKFDNLLKEALKKSHFSISEDLKCSDQFSTTGRIKGRQAIR